MGVDRAAIVADPGRALEPDAARRFQELRGAPARARAGRLHPRHEGLPAHRARGRPARADPAPGDRAPRRGACSTCRTGARVVRRRHGLGRGRARAQARAARPRGGRRRTRAPTRWRSRGRTRSGSGSTSRSTTATCSPACAGPLDAVVSNPPYVADGDRAGAGDRALRAGARAARRAGRARRDPAAAAGASARRRARARRARGRRRARPPPSRSCSRDAGFPEVETIARPRRASSAWWSAAGGAERAAAEADARVRALHARRAASPCSPPTRSTGSPASPTTPDAVERLYALKGRPPDKPAAVMFFALEPRARRAARARPAHARGARAAAARRRHAAAAQPARPLPARLRPRPGDARRCACRDVPALAGVRLAGAAELGQPRRRRRRARGSPTCRSRSAPAPTSCSTAASCRARRRRSSTCARYEDGRAGWDSAARSALVAPGAIASVLDSPPAS